MKNRKGFTLIELLVAITIIGIIMIMVLPAVHNLQRENQEKKFDDYERAVLEAAKVYEDQYEEDLYGRSDNGCASIDYNKLIEKKLISTNKIAGYECDFDGNDNGIIIRRVNGTSFYEVYLTCKKGAEEKNLTTNTGYSSIKNENCVVGKDDEPPILKINCDGAGEAPEKGVEGDDFNSTHIYYYSETNSNNKDEKRLPNLTVKASDNNSGLEKNIYVTYEWKIYTDRKDQEEINPNFTEKNRTTFNTKDGAGSTASKKVRIIEKFRQNNATGKAIIDLSGDNIIDRAGNKVNSIDTATQCVYFYDNEKPQMKITIRGNITGKEYSISSGEWINEPITTTVTVTDKTKNNNDIYSGINTDTFKRNDGNESLSGGTETYTYIRVDENRKEKDTYKVCDKVGNCVSQTVIIKVDTTKPKCTSRGGIPTWQKDDITIHGDCVDQGDPAHYSGCREDSYSKKYSDEQSITNATAGEACDNAGNCVMCSEDQDVHIDKTSPTCEFTDIIGENEPGQLIILTTVCRDNEALNICGHDEVGIGRWDENVHKEMTTFPVGAPSGTFVRDVWDMAGNKAQCKIDIAVSKCTSDCCGTHNCNKHCGEWACYSTDGVLQYTCKTKKTCPCASTHSGYVDCYKEVYDQCPDECTKAKCCGYHVSKSSGLSGVASAGGISGTTE